MKAAPGSQSASGAETALAAAKRVFRIESEAIAALSDRLGKPFLRAIETISACRGRVIITGIGKSGIIGKKIAATFSSTGTPALFLHAAEGLHGDLGVVQKDDVLICISKSGQNAELRMLLPLFQKLRIPVIALTGNVESALARAAAIVLDVSVKEEACPHDLAPTASSTATLAMGDALAVALLERRGFSETDFAMRHPGGTLGRRLLLRIDELMGEGDAVPVVQGDASLEQVILEISEKRYGATCVVDEAGRLAGIITDGDLRRLLSTPGDPRRKDAAAMMTVKPKSVRRGLLAFEALELLEKHDILQVVVVDRQRHPVGMVHLHDLLKAGVA